VRVCVCVCVRVCISVCLCPALSMSVSVSAFGIFPNIGDYISPIVGILGPSSPQTSRGAEVPEPSNPLLVDIQPRSGNEPG
jgi:hypothetical protein